MNSTISVQFTVTETQAKSGQCYTSGVFILRRA